MDLNTPTVSVQVALLGSTAPDWYLNTPTVSVQDTSMWIMTLIKSHLNTPTVSVQAKAVQPQGKTKEFKYTNCIGSSHHLAV